MKRNKVLMTQLIVVGAWRFCECTSTPGKSPRFEGVSVGEGDGSVPLYYFNVRCADEMDEDEEGLEFPDQDAAIADARICLLDMAREAARLHIDLDVTAMVITDWNDRVVATIPIGDALIGFASKH